MYRRYTQRREERVSVSRMKSGRIRDIIIVILLLSLAALAFFAVPAIRKQGSKQDTVVRRMQNECSEAVEQVKKLSHTAGTDAYYQLSMIRSNLHAILSLNEAFTGDDGGRLLTDEQTEQVDTLIIRIRNYYETVLQGSDTTVFVNSMQMGLNELKAVLEDLN